MGTKTTNRPQKKLPPPGRKVPLKEALASTMKRYEKTLAKLAK